MSGSRLVIKFSLHPHRFINLLQVFSNVLLRETFWLDNTPWLTPYHVTPKPTCASLPLSNVFLTLSCNTCNMLPELSHASCIHSLHCSQEASPPQVSGLFYLSLSFYIFPCHNHILSHSFSPVNWCITRRPTKGRQR